MPLPNLGADSLPSNAASPEIVVNTNDNLLDYAMNSHIPINFASDADLTLSTTGSYPRQWQYGVIELTDSGVVLTAGRNVIVPVNERVYRIVNNTAQTLTVKTSAGTGHAVLAGTGALVYCDGTNVENALPGAGGGAVDSVNGQVGAVVLELDDIDDVTLTTPAAGEVLTYDGTDWVNDTAPDTTYTVSAETDASGAIIRLTGSDASTDDILLNEGTNVTITRDDAGTITINASGGAGGGDVSGPGSSTNDAIVLWNGTSGDLVKDSGVLLSALAALGTAQTFTAAQRGEVTTLTSSANSVSVNLADSNNFVLDMTENTTLAAPSNAVEGQSGVITITQDSITAFTLAYNTFWKFEGGTVPALSTTLSSVNTFVYYINDGGASATCNLIGEIS